MLKVFISYSSQDKALGGLFKSCFEEYAGFSVFLAHEDIAPALEWELKIIKNLKESDVVIPLITDNYRTSEFTDQELGMALAWKKIIIPIKLSSVNPYGFIKKIQALKCRLDKKDINDSITTIVFVLTQSNEFNKFKVTVVDSVIGAFKNSKSFKSTRVIIRILTKIRNFNTKQANELKKAFRKNKKVFDEVYSAPVFKKYLKKNHKINIDS